MQLMYPKGMAWKRKTLMEHIGHKWKVLDGAGVCGKGWKDLGLLGYHLPQQDQLGSKFIYPDTYCTLWKSWT